MSRFGSDESEYEYGAPPLHEWELAGEWGQEGESEQFESEAEAEQYELTNELLAVTNEAELDRFLGNLIKSAGKFLNSGVGKAVGGVLKNVAKTALPVVGAAVGSALLPGVGTAIGGKLGSLAGGLLEVGEAETMGEAEAEFEAAHRFVQFGQATARNAELASPKVPPKTVARAAAVAAARKHAPGLLRPRPQSFRDRRDAGRPGAGATPQRRRQPGADRGQPGQRSGDRGQQRQRGADRGQQRQPGAGRGQQRQPGSDRDQPRRRPGAPWQWPAWQPAPWAAAPWPAPPWQPGQWQPSDAWAGPVGEPAGGSPGPAPWDAGDDGLDASDRPGPGAPADDDSAAESGFEFE